MCVYTSILSIFFVWRVAIFFVKLPRAEVCFEQVDEIDTGDFKYVGAGHGTYEQVTFIPEAAARGWGWISCNLEVMILGNGKQLELD